MGLRMSIKVKKWAVFVEGRYTHRERAVKGWLTGTQCNTCECISNAKLYEEERFAKARATQLKNLRWLNAKTKVVKVDVTLEVE